MITAADGLFWSPATYSAAKTLTDGFEPWVLVLLSDQPWPKAETGGTSDRRSTLRPVDPAPPVAGWPAGAAAWGAGALVWGAGALVAGAVVEPVGVRPVEAGCGGSESAQID
jgi:hypothetical protein